MDINTAFCSVVVLEEMLIGDMKIHKVQVAIVATCNDVYFISIFLIDFLKTS